MQQPAASQLPAQSVAIDTKPHQNDSEMEAAAERERSQAEIDRAQDSFIEQLINAQPGDKITKDKDLESRARIRQALAERLELAEGQLRRLNKKSKSSSQSSSLTPGQTRIAERSQARTEKITAAMAKWDRDTAKIARKQERASHSGTATEMAQEDQGDYNETAETKENSFVKSKKRGTKAKKQTEATLPVLETNAPKEKKRKRKRSQGQDEGHRPASNALARGTTNAAVEQAAESEAERDEPDAKAAEPDVESAEPAVEPKKPDAQSEKLDAQSEEPDAQSGELDAQSEEPDAQPEEPDAEPDTETDAEMGAEGEQPEEESVPQNAGAEIPTPPESDHESPNAIASDDPASTQTDAPEAMSLGETVSEQADKKEKKPKRKRARSSAVNASGEEPEPSRKRVRKSQHRADDEEEFAPPAASDVEQADRESTRNTKRHSTPSESTKLANHDIAAQMKWSERPSTSAGPFTAAEKAIADRVFNEVLRREHLSDAELRLKVKDWRNVGAFRVELEAALPSRPKASIRKFCQRKYHMNERGPWTAEQDEALRNAYANYPGEWTKLSDLVDRHPGDCKDRWTLHLQYGDKRETGPWSKDEEQKLMLAVKECISTIKKTSPDRANDREYLESMISWKVVSEKLGLARSTKTCREKFEKMKKRREQAKARQADEKKEFSKKYAAGVKAVEKFEIGDFYDVFTEIHESFEDVDKEYHNQINVVYSVTAMKNPASRFNLTARSKAIRRVALETALKDWKIDSKKFKRRLDQAETPPAQAKVLARWIEKQYKGRLHAMARTYMTDYIGKDVYEIINMKKERKWKYRKDLAKRAKTKGGQAKSKILSKELVEDSSDDEYLMRRPEEGDVNRDPDSSGDDVPPLSPPIREWRPSVEPAAPDAPVPPDADTEVDEDDEDPEGDFKRILDSDVEEKTHKSSSEVEDEDEDEDDDEDDDEEEGEGEGDGESEENVVPFAKQEPKSDDADVNMDEIPASQVTPPAAKHDAKPLPSPTTRRLSHALSGTPKLAPKDFSKRCRKAGRA
ncbi:unnamed protein product [Zymoseptoria tritici ST99CH_3D7]|uniref:Myb-like domain-containing protein n=3 Tax=Zymoseptoria tritici TaxID=1047171 RepID=A0A1X7RWR9_ZYMT9|nr:unnamed protein product [Zymoseptoria tritici ST99CH_3D7]